MAVVALNRTLDQELLALRRGASLECLACGEFVLRTDLGIVCPECGSMLEGRAAEAVQLGFETAAGGGRGAGNGGGPRVQ